MSRGRVDAEEVLGSRGRNRVLRVLSESGELNISVVIRRTGLYYTSVERHLVKLEKLGLVREKRYGKIRIFQTLFHTLTLKLEKGGDLTLEMTRAKEE